MRAISACALAVMAACGGGKAATFDAPPPDAGPDSAIDAAPAGTAHTYAMDRIILPTQNTSQYTLGLDLDGDGKIDNKLGRVMTIANYASSGVLNLQYDEDQAVDAQTVIDLVEVKATDLTDAVDVGFTDYAGALATGGGVEIAAGSPTDAFMLGDLSASAFVGGPGRATLTLSVFDSAPITLTLYGARATVGSVSASGLGTGVLAGGITQDALDNVLVPAMYTGISGQFAHDCTVGGTPPECGCGPGSTGAAYANLFDRAPRDCTISSDEVKSNQLIAPDLVPDVQLRTATGQPPTPCFSVGVGFTAVPASFTPP